MRAERCGVELGADAFVAVDDYVQFRGHSSCTGDRHVKQAPNFPGRGLRENVEDGKTVFRRVRALMFSFALRGIGYAIGHARISIAIGSE